MKAIIFSLFSLSSFAQISIKDDHAFFIHGSNSYRLNLSTLSNAQAKRIFSDYDLKSEINNFMRSRPAKSANLKDKMSKVRNQGQRGTCSFFATLGLVEHFYDKNSDLSEQCLSFYASKDDDGTINGSLDYIRSSGVYREDDCPYRDPVKYDDWYMSNVKKKSELEKKARDDIPNLANAKKVYPSFRVVSKSIDDFSSSELIEYLQTKIGSGHPVGVSIYVIGKEWDEGLIEKIPSKEEIEKSCNKGIGANAIFKQCSSHAIVITGYDDSRGVFYFKNSWDEDWGLNKDFQKTDNDYEKIGYGAISYGYLLKFRLNSASYLERS
jgi:C1A family cysteine protease